MNNNSSLLFGMGNEVNFHDIKLSCPFAKKIIDQFTQKMAKYFQMTDSCFQNAPMKQFHTKSKDRQIIVSHMLVRVLISY